MNQKLGIYGSIINIGAVFGFALSMLLESDFAAYIFSIFIALGFVPMIAAFSAGSANKKKAAGQSALAFAAVYAAVIILVYYAQLTAVRLDNLSEQAALILDYSKFGLFFSYDLVGYAMMALSTFFAGLSITPSTRIDRWLKGLLLAHGMFFVSCFLLPILGVFKADMAGADWIGTAVLEFWCAYFIPIGILSLLHFVRKNKSDGREI